ncbi:hypothetical protein [Aquimarina aggregata]|uniref:hypothetical protein n=1 Tax=Aquimarina aggregata TaxID=1642818 RepID=UPI002490A0C5|nr:hypothetical protein [Aquimarina aggregata]
MNNSTKEILDKKIINRIMNRAIEINDSCKEHCREFRIMKSKKHKNTFILRWLTIDASDVGRLFQCYRYECFDVDGTPQYCSIHYSNQEEANEFFKGLEPLYAQEYAVDHKSK